jgi:signal transduction histidine kinase
VRLLAKTSAYFFVIIVFVLLIGGFIFYSGLRHILYNQIDEGLLTEESIIEEEIRSNWDIPDYTTRFGHEIEVLVLFHTIKPYTSISDTSIFNKDQNDYLLFRHLYVAGNINGRGYSIRILHPLDETRLLIRSIIEVLLIILLFVLLCLLAFNFIVSRKIWKPFYNTIFQIRRYDIKLRDKLQFIPSNINEFDTLNKVLTNMANKIEDDFINLKEFTEDASHEIQTPLAIIKSKLEIFIQSTNLTKEQIASVQVINHAISRLSKINAGLLLITKIDNNQYEKEEVISLNVLIRNTLEVLDDFIAHKNLQVKWNKEDLVSVTMSPSLADILVNNLINNAIKHNVPNGYIAITLTQSAFVLENSGIPLNNRNVNDPNDLFYRFKKDSMSDESIGLGLAIVKKICDTYHLFVSYSIKEDIHSLSINIPVEK